MNEDNQTQRALENLAPESDNRSELRAYQRVINEFKSMSCCLCLIHVLLAVGINAHLVLSTKDLHSETRVCYFIIPSSYALFLIFNFFVVMSSLFSVKFVESPVYNIIFLEKLRACYILMILLGLSIIAAVFVPGKVCFSKNKMSVWPAFWGMFTIIESLSLIMYIRWLIKELRGFRERTFAANRPVHENILKELELEKKLEDRTFDDSVVVNMNDVSMDSVTTM